MCRMLTPCAEQEIPLGQRSGSASLLARSQVFPFLHEDPAPSIWRGIKENAKVGAIGTGILRSRNQREIGVKRERCGPLEPPVVIREGQDVPSAAALATKCTHQGRFLKLGQVDKDRDNFGTPRRHDSSLDFLGTALASCTDADSVT